jgi:hypothetical protein
MYLRIVGAARPVGEGSNVTDKQIWKNSEENWRVYGVVGNTTKTERIVVRNLGEDAEKCKESIGYRTI